MINNTVSKYLVAYKQGCLDSLALKKSRKNVSITVILNYNY